MLFFCLLNDIEKDLDSAKIQEIVLALLRFETKESIYPIVENEFHDFYGCLQTET